MKLHDFIKSNSLEQLQEIVFFGGSFNPWHSGHSSCINLLSKNKTIIVIPDHNPLKELVESSNKLTSINDLKRKISSFNRNLYLFTGFFESNKKNPTSLWIKDLSKHFPNIKLSLLMGYDSFMSLDKWLNAKDLLSTLDTIYIASRLDVNEAKVAQMELLKAISNLNIEFLGNHDFEHLSSSDIRNE